MVYIYIFAVLSALALIYMRFEAGYVEVKRIRFTKNRNALKIIQLSDIHIKRLKVSSKKIRLVIENEKPDFIIITGDYIEGAQHIPLFLKFLEDIRAKCSMFLCFGNHDYRAFLKRKDYEGMRKFISNIEQKGISVLHDRSVVYEKNRRKYNVIGISNPGNTPEYIDKLLKSCCSDAFCNVAFSHNPDVALELPKGKVDYLFCGHFHGGQIWAPFDLEFKILRDEKLCKMGIKRGLHRINGINLYINRGLGNVCFPLRFLSRPEITVYYLP